VSQHLKASFEIVFRIAKQKTPHTIGEELIKPCVLKTTQIILGEDAEHKMKTISLCDESTDIVDSLCSLHWRGYHSIREFVLPIFDSRARNGYIVLFIGKLWTLNSAIRIVNHSKSSALNSRLFTLLWEDLDSDRKVLLFHTEVRWLFKCNMLAGLYELKEEVILSLEFKEKHDFLTMFKYDTFQWSLAYLTYIFVSLNELNFKLQCRNNTIKNNYDYIQGFILEFQLWNQKVSSENVISFFGCSKQLKITYWTQI
ncbi:unnamed protein product, partial [Acanthoscelides obtectus]